MKRPTIYDVAREAGVSAATVSYVINGRDDQKISDATRKKIMQIVNLLGYSRNRSAYTLAKGGDDYVAVAADTVGELGDAAVFCFMKAFSEKLSAFGKKLSYVTTDAAENLSDACALVLFGVSSERFKHIADANMITVVAVDCLLDNPLFFKVNSDFPAMRAAADGKYGEGRYVFLCADTRNAELKELITRSFPRAVFLSSFADIRDAVLSSGDLPTVIFGEEIASLFPLLAQGREYTLFPRFSDEKVDAVGSCIHHAIDRTPALTHDVFI